MCDKTKNNENIAIDILRFLCAILVIAIHTKPFLMSNYNLYFFIQVISRLAVPIFFTITGIYCLGDSIDAVDIDGGGEFRSDVVLGTIRKLIRVYFYWSLVYVIYLYFSGKNYSSISQTLWFAWTYLKRFFFEGTSAHLWFVLAEIYWLFIISVFFRKPVTRRFLIVCVTIFYLVGVIINVFSLLPDIYVFTLVRQFLFLPPMYLILGYMISIMIKKKGEIKIGLGLLFLAMAALLSLYLGGLYLRESILQKNDLSFSFMQIFVVASVILLCLKCKKESRYGRLIRAVANNIYFVHVLVIYVITRICVYGFKMNESDIDSSELFILDTIFSLAVATVIVAVNRSFNRRLQ